MTYMTMNIRTYPDAEIPDDLRELSTRSTKIINLDHLARECGPYHTCRWAEPRGIPIYDIDNCWMFFAMRRDQLVAFNEDQLAGAADLSRLDAYPAETLYVLESEEY